MSSSPLLLPSRRRALVRRLRPDALLDWMAVVLAIVRVSAANESFIFGSCMLYYGYWIDYLCNDLIDCNPL